MGRGKRVKKTTSRVSEKALGEAYETAETIALIAHSGQRRRGSGEPYISHPLRVAAGFEGIAKIAAILHDVVEDTPVTLAKLKAQGIPPQAIEIIDLLSRRQGEVYMRDFIERIATAPGEAGSIARAVKLADIADNLRGVELLPPEEQGITKRYKRARSRLLAAQSTQDRA